MFNGGDMTEKYTGTTQDRRYEGKNVDITYNLKRCIHAKVCVNRLSEVFDVDKRPWIDADGASADDVANVIQLCPSGALHYERKGDGTGEPIPPVNRIILHPDEYIQFIGNLEIQGATVDLQAETRASLCRCGASSNKPFCDNTHKEIEFTAETTTPMKVDDDRKMGGNLQITAHADGPYEIVGNFQIEDVEGEIIFTGTKTWLCRCGGSNKKPFCDGTHNNNGFQAE